MYSFGAKLKKLRIDAGLTQGELATKLNEMYRTSINKGMISKWENDREEPRMEAVRNITNFFGVTLDELLDIKHENKVTENTYDVGKELEEIINNLNTVENVTYFGTDLNDHLKGTVKISLENLIALTNQLLRVL